MSSPYEMLSPLSAALVIVGFGAVSVANTGKYCLHTLVVRHL